MKRTRRWGVWGCACLTWLGMTEAAAAAQPTLEDALNLKPVQSDVDYDAPKKDQIAKCTFKSEKLAGLSGWIVRDESGQILRAFIDTNGDKTVDQWSYYKDGVEIYRDIDSNHNQKADQFRWVNGGGSRWGLDADEDTVIDVWKQISAEEATAEAVAAIAQGNVDRFARLLPSPDEIKSLGLGADKAAAIKQKASQAVTDFKALVKTQKAVAKDAQWVHFGGSRPGLVPAGTDGSTKDLLVYENVLAMIESDGKQGQVPIGSLIRVGDAWRLIEAPNLDESTTQAATLFTFNSVRPDSPEPGDNAASGEYDRLVQALEELSAKVEEAGKGADADALRKERNKAFERVMEAAQSPQDRGLWLRNLADTLMADAQSGDFPQGVKELAELHDRLIAQEDLEAAAYVEFRRLTAQYNLDMQDPKANFAAIQTTWLEDLRSFVEKHPQSPDASEAMLQLALAEEFAGQEEEAKSWYSQIVEKFPEAPAAAKSRGAIVRLDCVGKAITLKGPSPDGKTKVDLAQLKKKVVVVQYWATTCEPCIADFAQLKELQAKYQKKGLAIIGVSLDSNKKELDAFLKQNRLPGAQIYEPGGLDSRLANEMGILSLPTMLLIDQQGKVVSRNVHVSELDKEIKALLP